MLVLSLLLGASSCRASTITPAQPPAIDVGNAEPEAGPIPSGDADSPALAQLVSLVGPSEAQLGQIITLTLYTDFDPHEDIADVALVLADSDVWFKIPARVEPAPQSAPAKWQLQVPVAIAVQSDLANSTLKLELALMRADDSAGGYATHNVDLGSLEDSVSCPGDAACGALSCGPDPICATECGSCLSGEACNLDGVCEGIGDACPDAMACGERECGPDPVCGTSCGYCPDGEACSAGNCIAASDQDCCEANSGPSCNDLEVAACVCESDRYCCNSQWDAVCVQIAGEQCGACGVGDGDGDGDGSTGDGDGSTGDGDGDGSTGDGDGDGDGSTGDGDGDGDGTTGDGDGSTGDGDGDGDGTTGDGDGDGAPAYALALDFEPPTSLTDLCEGVGFTFGGNASQSSVEFVSGASSWRFFTAMDSVETQNQPGANFGSDDFTIELWAWIDDSAGDNMLVGASSGDGDSWHLSVNGDAVSFVHEGTGGTVDVSAPFNPGSQIWTHFAVTRVAGAHYLFVNGNEENSQADVVTYNPAADNVISLGYGVGTGSLVGYIDDLRIIKGVAMYTTTFTPPSGSPMCP
jgi:hypothetical protein